MGCKHYARRTMKKRPYCRLNREWNPVCCGCNNKEYKEYKTLKYNSTIKKKTYKQAKKEKNRFSILTDDMLRCAECGEIYDRKDLNYHEVFFGRNRQLSIKYGLVIPLHWSEFHNQIESKGIHFDKELCLKWQEIAQLKAMAYYNWSEQDFIDIFGRSYLDKK